MRKNNRNFDKIQQQMYTNYAHSFHNFNLLTYFWYVMLFSSYILKTVKHPILIYVASRDHLDGGGKGRTAVVGYRRSD